MPGCKRKMRVDHFCCSYDWHELPREFQDRVWAAHRANDRAATVELMAEIVNERYELAS